MKNNKLAAFFFSTALVIPGIIASTSNPANAEPIEQQTQEVLETPNIVDDSSINSAVKKPTIETYINTPVGNAEVNISLPLKEANCLIQNSGLNPLSVLPVRTLPLSCAGSNLKNYIQQKF